MDDTGRTIQRVIRLAYEWIQEPTQRGDFLEFAFHGFTAASDDPEEAARLAFETLTPAHLRTSLRWATVGIFGPLSDTDSTRSESFLTEMKGDLEPGDDKVIKAFGSALTNLYNVSKVESNGEISLEDVGARLGKRVVYAPSESQYLREGDFISARIAPFDGKLRFLGPILAFTKTTRVELIAGFDIAVSEELKRLPKYLRKEARQIELARCLVLNASGSIFSMLWALDGLRLALEVPQLSERWEHETMFFPISFEGATELAVIRERLQGQSDFLELPFLDPQWAWFMDPAKEGEPADGFLWFSPDGLNIVANEDDCTDWLLMRLGMIFGITLGKPTREFSPSMDDDDDAF